MRWTVFGDQQRETSVEPPRTHPPHRVSKSDLAQAEPVASLSSLNNHENFIIPVDFRILSDFLSHGGVSFHSVGYARGPGRVTRAIEDALRSPLVADYDINQAKSVLVQHTMWQPR